MDARVNARSRPYRHPEHWPALAYSFHGSTEKMTEINRDSVLAALRTGQEPELHQDLVSLGMVRNLEIQDGQVSVVIMLTTPACPLRTQIEREARVALLAV